MNLHLENKVALVTGGSTGIGRAIAGVLANEGARVLIVARKEAELKESAAQHENIGYIPADLTKDEDIQRIYDRVLNDYGRLDILVNNAGWAPVTPIEQIQMDEYDRCYDINVRSVVALTLKTLPLIKANKGNIINISSAAVLFPMPTMSIYAGAKGAIDITTRAWAKALAKDGVRVNSVNVGPIWTPIYEKTDLDAEGAQKHIDAVTSTIPLGRFGQPEDVASVVAFLASDQAGFVTGSAYGVTGGVGA